ncbi:MAG: hypothetical protein ABL974_01310 [Prosthecobacter sp.]
MKPNTLAVITSLALSGSAFSASPPPLPAEPGVWGAVSTMTIALTVSYTAPGTVLKDETGKILTVANGGGPAFENQYSVITNNAAGDEIRRVETAEAVSKVVTYRYGNVDLLKELVLGEILPQKGASPFIAGWTFVVVTDGSRTKMLYARHTDKTMIPLDGTGFGIDEGAIAVAFTENFKDVVTTVTNPVTGLQTITRSLTDTSSAKAVGSGAINGPAPLTFTGLYTDTGSKTVIKVETIAGEKISTDVFLPGAQKLDKIIGAAAPGEGSAGVVEGTMSTTASVLTDMNLYMPAF